MSQGQAFSYGKRVAADHNGVQVLIVIDTPDIIDSIRFQTDMTRMRAVEAAADAATKIYEQAVAKLKPTTTQRVIHETGDDTPSTFTDVEVPEPITDIDELEVILAEAQRASELAGKCMAQREVEFANLVSRVARYVAGFEQVDGTPILFRTDAEAPQPWIGMTSEYRNKYARQLFNLFLGPVLSSLGAGAELSELKK